MRPTVPVIPGNTAIEKVHPLHVIDELATTKRFHLGEDICSGGYVGPSWFRIISGVAKRCVTLSSGRQQIVDLVLPGDIFAHPANERGALGVEAATDVTSVAIYPCSRLRRVGDVLAASLSAEVACASARRYQAHIHILGRATALGKTGAFISALAERSARESGQPAVQVTLPVSRYDMADYLSLSVETVSRTLTELKQRRLIAFLTPRTINIVDNEALATCGDAQFGPSEWQGHHSSLSPVGASPAKTARRMASASL